MNISALQPYLITKEGTQNITELLKTLHNELFTENFLFDAALSEHASYDKSNAISQTASENGINIADKSALQHFFISVQDEIKILPVVHIILSFRPKEGLVREIHDWFYEKFKKIVILDISADPEIIAGGVISFAGKANDYSLRGKIEQMR